MLSHTVALKNGNEGLPENTIRVNFTGTAGQSFGGWLAKGITFTLSGDANDYVGKGLCGGRIVIAPPAASKFKADENIIIGNVAFYGATAGEGYIRGIAAERFCVRNSGARVVVEGVGDHGCEYMTGGRAVILGSTGRNFAAGMSGGIAYVRDGEGKFAKNCNTGMVALEKPDADDFEEILDMVRSHQYWTGSKVAAAVLGNWEKEKAFFVKVIPEDYKKVMLAKQGQKEAVNG